MFYARKNRQILCLIHLPERREFSKLHMHEELLVELLEKYTKGAGGTVTKNYPEKNSNTGEI